MQPGEYLELLSYGIGLTDVCKTQTGSDRGLSVDGFDVRRLTALLVKHRPRAIAFNGKKAAQIVLGRNVDYGDQHERLAEARVFVLPSTSGAARSYWDIYHRQHLAEAAR